MFHYVGGYWWQRAKQNVVRSDSILYIQLHVNYVNCWTNAIYIKYVQKPTLVTANSSWVVYSIDIVLLVQYATKSLVEREMWAAFLFSVFPYITCLETLYFRPSPAWKRYSFAAFARTSLAWCEHGTRIRSSCTISSFSGSKEVGTRARTAERSTALSMFGTYSRPPLAGVWLPGTPSQWQLLKVGLGDLHPSEILEFDGSSLCCWHLRLSGLNRRRK